MAPAAAPVAGSAAQVVAVAASGGRDSTALLHCSLRQAAALGLGGIEGLRVLALHVHHGLQAEADGWADQVRAQARRWGAGFACTRLTGQPAAGDSVEAWARRGRYAALVQMAQAAGCGLVLLGQHRRDQAETVLLQALRGAGPSGLAAMPAQRCIDGVVFARPWLEQPREAIEAYVKRHRLRFVDDSSNADPRYSRNRLRLQLWPALMQAFPEAENTLRHTALRGAEARALAEECAAADMAAAAPPEARADHLPRTLLAEPLRGLSQARRRNVLRVWLARVQPQPVPETLVRRLADELLTCRHARWPGPGGQVALRRKRLDWVKHAAA
jgi:tRNA(Ile)-lysidine synthase